MVLVLTAIIFEAKLEDTLIHFLWATALWNPQWFNKRKLHVLIHIILHIRRFGPAVLFATESQESYNSIIRLQSIHSPHQAPSLDIANGFSHIHAVRHLVSGGLLFRDIDGSPLEKPRQAGSALLRLTEDPEFTQLMAMQSLTSKELAGMF